jgi:hypothetical protein
MTATEQRPLHPQSNLIAHAVNLLLGSVWDKETIRPLESRLCYEIHLVVKPVC